MLERTPVRHEVATSRCSRLAMTSHMELWKARIGRRVLCTSLLGAVTVHEAHAAETAYPK
jgi:hypothetical protein